MLLSMKKPHFIKKFYKTTSLNSPLIYHKTYFYPIFVNNSLTFLNFLLIDYLKKTFYYVNIFYKTILQNNLMKRNDKYGHYRKNEIRWEENLCYWWS